MVEPAARWTPESAWAGVMPVGRSGLGEGAAGLLVAPRDGLSLATVIARRDRAGALSARLQERFGVESPVRPRVAVAPELTLIWSGHERWLALSERAELFPRLIAEAADLAAITDQGASRAVLRLSGSRVRDVLAKGCMVDLHPRAFQVGDVALTPIAHLGVQLWRADDHAFEIAVARSCAASLWSWLSASAAEFGCETRGPNAG